ncbi:MAG: hypothetical protein ACPHQ8_03030 [Candidatus Puniceispirillaceae bacterium]
MLTNLVLGEDQLSLSINGGQARFDYFWLRDNARDPVSFDTRSNQRELFTALVDPAIRPRNGWVDDDAGTLVLEWPDLDVAAHYEAGFLAEFAQAGDPMRLPDSRPWNAASLDPDSVRLSFDAFQLYQTIAVHLSAALRRAYVGGDAIVANVVTVVHVWSW